MLLNIFFKVMVRTISFQYEDFITQIPGSCESVEIHCFTPAKKLGFEPVSFDVYATWRCRYFASTLYYFFFFFGSYFVSCSVIFCLKLFLAFTQPFDNAVLERVTNLFIQKQTNKKKKTPQPRIYAGSAVEIVNTLFLVPYLRIIIVLATVKFEFQCDISNFL